MRWAVYFLVFLFLPGYAQEITFAEAFPGLTFTAPIEMLVPPNNSNRVFIVQQNGIIKVLPDKQGATSTDIKEFINISSNVVYGGERGLLGMAFHPDYETNGYFYVNYTRPSPLTSVISRFSVKADNPEEADPLSEVILLTQSQPYDNHNGGKLAFGNDGYLYISLGDGGSAGDPQDYAQNRASLLGKILRIDVGHSSGDLNYSIPDGNPFKNNTEGYREEIFAFGLRNVWKFSIDPPTGNIWAADVGQNRREEINLVVNGGNYGWRLMEGSLCYNPSTNCNPGGLILPIFEYAHGDNNRSITGGFVYRGIQIPEWEGQYLYGDYVSGRIWKLAYENNVASNSFLLLSGGLISSFGEDQNGEPYVLQYSTGNSGKIFRFFPSPPAAPSDIVLQHKTDSNQLEWVDGANNELGFIIERSLVSENNFETLDTVARNTTGYTDFPEGNPDEFTYRIKAYNDGGESAYAYADNVILRSGGLFSEQIKIYPNPCTGVFMIELSEQFPESHLRVFDLLKREVHAQPATERTTVVDLRQFSPGLYIVEIKNRSGSTAQKIIFR